VDIQRGQFRYRPYDKVVNGFAAYSVDMNGAINQASPGRIHQHHELPRVREVDATVEIPKNKADDALDGVIAPPE
jgi:hypothetical protein